MATKTCPKYRHYLSLVGRRVWYPEYTFDPLVMGLYITINLYCAWSMCFHVPIYIVHDSPLNMVGINWQLLTHLATLDALLVSTKASTEREGKRGKLFVYFIVRQSLPPKLTPPSDWVSTPPTDLSIYRLHVIRDQTNTITFETILKTHLFRMAYSNFL